jgi:steroid 5-alpha reductase family enzyme
MQRLINAIKESSLTIVLFTLFVICISAQSFAGWRLQNETLAAHGQASAGYWHYLSTGTFLEGLASNWQAAVLQLASLIVFSGFLYQRGAPHSRDPRKAKRKNRWKTAGRSTWLYRNSLFLAFLLLFLLAFALHIGVGASAYNEDRALAGQPPISIAAFLLSAKFWSTTLQTWQAEYLVCRAQHLSAPAGLGGVEAGWGAQQNHRQGERVSDTPACPEPMLIPRRCWSLA